MLDRRRWLGDVLGEHRGDRRTLEGKLAGERVEGDDAERVDVAAVIHRLTARLLGTHVLRGAENLADARHPGAVRDARDAEIGDEGAAGTALDQDVVRLDVAVHHALRVRVGQAPGHLAQNPRRLRRRQRSATPDALAERFAVDERHDEEDQVAHLFDREDGNDVRVRELGRCAGFVQEALSQRRVTRQVRWQQLEGDQAVERHVACEIDDSHSAAAKLALERVPARERGLDPNEFAGGLTHRLNDGRRGDGGEEDRANAQGAPPDANYRTPPYLYSMADDVAGFLTHLEKERDVSPNTVTAYRRDLAEFTEFSASTTARRRGTGARSTG